MSDTQINKVLKYLKRCTNKGLSQAEAVDKFRCYRLGGVIYKLKKRGYMFHVEREKNKHNTGIHARYFLTSSPNDLK